MAYLDGSTWLATTCKGVTWGISILVLLCGILITAICGLMTLSQANPYSDAATLEFHNPYLKALGVGVFILGVIMLVVGIVGFIAACKENIRWFNAYSILLIVLIAVEIAAVIAIIVGRNLKEEDIEKSMADHLQQEYGKRPEATSQWNLVQYKFECCGGRGFYDYKDSYYANASKKDTEETSKYGFPIPATCCKLTKDSDYKDPKPLDYDTCKKEAYEFHKKEAKAKAKGKEYNPNNNDKLKPRHLYYRGCFDGLLDFLHENFMVIIIAIFVLISLQGFGFFSIRCCVIRTLKQFQDYDTFQ